ncbi:major facilitator family transporter [Pseudomonas putida S11]|nr:major facilitator family transporter [Pseudomonas putida S11]
MSAQFGWGREVFSFAIAIQNLVWGFAQPFAGALADRYGAGKVVGVGGVFYVLGLVCMSFSDSASTLMMSAGVLIGIGLSGTSFSVLLGVVARALPARKTKYGNGACERSGILWPVRDAPRLSGASSKELAGRKHFWFSPCSPRSSSPLVAMLKDAPTERKPGDQSIVQALRAASSHPDFWLLTFGFFVCGFQVVFIGVHLPAYLMDKGLTAQTGTTVLALIGLFNILGTYTAGWLGGRMSKPKLLTALYLMRAAVIVAFVAIPVSNVTAYLFGMAMGFLWLSTVPLTNGVVASVFGVRNLSMLGGLVYLFHQVGAFLGRFGSGGRLTI